MKVLHLASFRGNLGEYPQPFRFSPGSEELVGEEIDWVDLEIRDFYRRETSSGLVD